MNTSDLNILAKNEISTIAKNIGDSLQLLGREIELTPTQLSELKQGTQSLEEKAHILLEWWMQREGNNATTSTMAEALKNVSRKDISDMILEENYSNNNKSGLTKLVPRLFEMYSRISIPQPPGIHKDIPIDDIFIDQDMEEIDNKSPNKKIVKLENIFQSIDGNNPTKILVEGDPGFGKTTLTTKLATDWAKGKRYISSKFKLVIQILLRDVRNANVEEFIVEIMNRRIGDKCVKKEKLHEFMAENKVLLLLDGYDELTPDGKQNLQCVLLQNKLQPLCILITSRRGLFTTRDTIDHSTAAIHAKNEDLEYQFWDTRIVIKGLSQQQIIDYLTNNFNINPDIMENIFENLFLHNPNEIFRCPLLAFWLGWMLEHQRVEEKQTRTSFYKSLINLILQKTLERDQQLNPTKSNNSVHNFDIFTTSNSESEMLISLKMDLQILGKLAVNSLIENQFTFNESDFKELSNSVILVSDIFVKYKTFTNREEETHYQPMHRSFLEFFAAFSVCNSNNNEPLTFDEFKQNIANLVHRGLVPSLESLFFPFVAGLMQEQAHWLFKSLTRWAPIYHLSRSEMLHVVNELTHDDEKTVQALLPFVTSHYKIYNWESASQSFHSSNLHDKLFQLAVQNNIISIMNWDISFLNILPISEITLQRLYLTTSDKLLNIQCTTSIRCNELICHISEDVTAETWNMYLSVVASIQAEQVNLFVENVGSSTLSMILNEIQRGHWHQLSFQKTNFFFCPFENSHLETISHLVNKNRIQKSIRVVLSQDHQLVSDCISELWNVVIGSETIQHFCYVSFTDSNLIPDFYFFPGSEMKNRIKFKMVEFRGYFTMNAESDVDSVEELVIYPTMANEIIARDIITHFPHLRYLQCNDFLFSCCASKNIDLLSSLEELYLDIHDNFPLTKTPLPSLKSLVLNFSELSLDNECPTSLKDFLAIILQMQNLQIIEFNYIKSLSVLNSLMAYIFRLQQKVKVHQLQLTFQGDWVMNLCSNDFTVLKDLLKKQQLKHVTFTHFTTSCPFWYILPSLFQEDEFEFKCKIYGKSNKDSISAKQDYMCMMLDEQIQVKIK